VPKSPSSDKGKDTLTRRVRQILTGVHWAEEPPSRACHLVTNMHLLRARPGGSAACQNLTVFF